MRAISGDVRRVLLRTPVDASWKTIEDAVFAAGFERYGMSSDENASSTRTYAERSQGALFAATILGSLGYLILNLRASRSSRASARARLAAMLEDAVERDALAGVASADAKHGLLSVPGENAIAGGDLSFPKEDGALSRAEEK